MSIRNLHYYHPNKGSLSREMLDVDICVYGGTSGGAIAAVQAARDGLKVVLLAFGKKIGGMTAGGLGRTDIGRKEAFGGMALEFYRLTGKLYNTDEAWYFEPSIAEKAFEILLEEAGVQVFRCCQLQQATVEQNRIQSVEMENGLKVKAKMFIDATYEGDLMAKAGVSYTVGREDNSQYDELFNGIHFGHPNHNFRCFVDPWRKEGDPSSGLLQGISDAPAGLQGQGDKSVQAYNFRVCLTKAENRLPFPQPANYDPERYTLFARYLNRGVWDALHLTAEMPNGKTDTNNWGGFSSDNIGANHRWPEGSYAEREMIFQDHVSYNLGMYWFLCNDDRVPAEVRAAVREYGLPVDEFTDTGGWPHELYIREARRMVSDYVMTEHNCVGRFVAEDSVGLASYQMDSHHCRRLVIAGRVVNEGNVEIGVISPYPISYRSIVPARGECGNLLVPFCLSASHIAFGSIRMEPVFMALSQAAASAAAIAIRKGSSVQEVPYSDLKAVLQEQKQRLQWPAG